MAHVLSPRLAATAVLLLLPCAAVAAPFDPNLHVDPAVKDCSVRFAPNLTQGAYRRFVREFGSVSAFKQASAPTALGAGHVAAGIEAILFRVEEHAAAWNDTFTHPAGDHPLGSDKRLGRLRARVGVTDALELGAYFTLNPEANYGWLGLEGKGTVLAQQDGAPVTVAVRGAYTKTLYVRDMDMHALTVDVSAGRTAWRVLTPYLGAGVDGVLARETSPAVDLRTEAVLVPHLVGGVELRTWRLVLGVEVQVAALTSYQAQVAWVF